MNKFWFFFFTLACVIHVCDVCAVCVSLQQTYNMQSGFDDNATCSECKVDYLKTFKDLLCIRMFRSIYMDMTNISDHMLIQ